MGILKADLTQLLEKEMDRKDFLKHVAVAVVALTGASAVLKSLTVETKTPVQKPEGNGYGSSSYGG